MKHVEAAEWGERYDDGDGNGDGGGGGRAGDNNVMLQELATCCMSSVRNDHQAEPEHLVAQGAAANNGFNTQFHDSSKHERKTCS